jgi:hypothetical protein
MEAAFISIVNSSPAAAREVPVGGAFLSVDVSPLLRIERNAG